MRFFSRLFFSLLFVWPGTAFALQFSAEELPNGLRFVVVRGAFEADDDLRPFVELVAANSARFVVFNSSGGNVAKAMDLGRTVRSLGLTTIEVRGMDCASACALAFFGGVSRVAEPGTIAMHKSSFSPEFQPDARDAVSYIQQATADMIAYMVEMGIDPALLQLALRYDSDDLRYLSRSEMELYRVVTVLGGEGREGTEPDAGLATARQPQAVPRRDAPAKPMETVDLSIPRPKSGTVRRPGGKAALKAGPEPDTRDLAFLPNGRHIDILDVRDDWYRIRAGANTGYVHNTWVMVDQFATGPFDGRHIQVKSLQDYDEAQSYARAASPPLAVYLATNGWFAITLDGTFGIVEAKQARDRLKAAGTIPDDSIITYGNNYVRKVCCQ